MVNRKDTSMKQTIKENAWVCLKTYAAYKILYLLILGFIPSAHHYYLQWYSDYKDVLPAGVPERISEVKEIFGVHDFEGIRPHLGYEAIIFRNFSDCKSKFDNILYPRRKDQIDTYLKIEKTEETRGSMYVAGVKRTNETLQTSLKDLLKDANPSYYASFLRIFGPEDYQVMLNANNETKFKRDSSFISHFDRAMVSTPVHSAPIADTYSVQCYGVKSWLMFKHTDLEKHGFIPIATPHGVIINGSPDSMMRVPGVRAVVYPGDVLYFPPFYYHAVATSKGKNIMFAVRHIHKGSFYRSFRISFHNTFFAITRTIVKNIYNKVVHKSTRGGFVPTAQDLYVPFKDAYDNDIYEKQWEAFKHIDRFDDFQMPEKW